MHPAPRRLPAIALALALALVGTVYTAAGFTRLVSDVPGSFPIDLRLRWVESRLLLEGRNPQRAGHPDPMLPPTHEVMRNYGSGYPAWSHTFGLLLVPPLEWDATRYYYAGVCLLSLAGLSLFAWRRARPFGVWEAAVASLLVFTNFSVAICVSYGQYGVVVSALLAGSVALLERRRDWQAGVLFGLSLVKPQLTALYGVALVAQRRWRPCVMAGLLLAAGTAVMGLAVHQTPMAVAARSGVEVFNPRQTTNIVMVTAERALGRRAILVVGMTATLLMGWLAWTRLDDGDLFRLASVAVLLAMFWTYRKHFDVAMMSVPLVYLWIQAARTRRRQELAVFLAVAVTLWVPLRDAQWELAWVQAVHTVVWLGAAVFLIRTAREAGTDPVRA